MPPLPTPEEWAQIRHEYENTRRSIEDICLAHGISANTLRRRVRAWGWQMRHPPISDQEPEAVARSRAPDERFEPLDRFEPPHPLPQGEREYALPVAMSDSEPSPHLETADTRPAGERLQGAAARLMRAIETTSARLTAGIHLRETEMAARALGSLTRTLNELNGLLAQHKALEPKGSVDAERDDPPPEDTDDFRNELARRIRNFVEQHEAKIPARYEAAWQEFATQAKQG
jgi:hypothetical protein